MKTGVLVLSVNSLTCRRRSACLLLWFIVEFFVSPGAKERRVGHEAPLQLSHHLRTRRLLFLQSVKVKVPCRTRQVPI